MILLSSERVTGVIQPEIVRTLVESLRTLLWDSSRILALVGRFKWIQLFKVTSPPHCLSYGLVSCVHFTSLTRL